MTATITTHAQPVVLTGGEPHTGFKQRILAYCMENGIEMSGAKARRLGQRMWKRAVIMQQEFDFYRELRILGVYQDKTARNAIEGRDPYA